MSRPWSLQVAGQSPLRVVCSLFSASLLCLLFHAGTDVFRCRGPESLGFALGRAAGPPAPGRPGLRPDRLLVVHFSGPLRLVKGQFIH